MDAPGVGLGQNEGFVYQARAFLEEVAGIDEPTPCPAAPRSTRACTTWRSSRPSRIRGPAAPPFRPRAGTEGQSATPVEEISE